MCDLEATGAPSILRFIPSDVALAMMLLVYESLSYYFSLLGLGAINAKLVLHRLHLCSLFVQRHLRVREGDLGSRIEV